MAVQFASESVSRFRRNGCPVWVGIRNNVPQNAMYLMIGHMTYAKPEYVTRQVVREVNLVTDLSTLMAEVDTWPTKG